MKANYAEIWRVGSLEAYVQQVLLVQFFWNFQAKNVFPRDVERVVVVWLAEN